MVRLVEISEIFPVTLKFRPHNRYEYERTFFLPKDYPRVIELWELIRYAHELSDKFPDRGYEVVGRRLHGVQYYILKKKRRDRFYVPLWFEADTGLIYVPQSFLKRRKARVARVLVATLGGLGYTLPYED